MNVDDHAHAREYGPSSRNARCGRKAAARVAGERPVHVHSVHGGDAGAGAAGALAQLRYEDYETAQLIRIEVLAQAFDGDLSFVFVAVRSPMTATPSPPAEPRMTVAGTSEYPRPNRDGRRVDSGACRACRNPGGRNRRLLPGKSRHGAASANMGATERYRALEHPGDHEDAVEGRQVRRATAHLPPKGWAGGHRPAASEKHAVSIGAGSLVRRRRNGDESTRGPGDRESAPSGTRAAAGRSRASGPHSAARPREIFRTGCAEGSDRFPGQPMRGRARGGAGFDQLVIGEGDIEHGRAAKYKLREW